MSTGIKELMRRFNRFDRGIGLRFPEAYKKFYKEWKWTTPTAVHYIPKEGKYERNPVTGIVRPIQNRPIPLRYPPEIDEGIYGGEGVIQGFQKRDMKRRRVPHWWVPVIRRSVVHSVILNQYLATIVTDRALALINECKGFDHYILKTPACDLRSLLALKLKSRMLRALKDGCPDLADNPERQREVLAEYASYAEPFTDEEIEWYGLSWDEACDKLERQECEQEEADKIPHKLLFRARLIEQLREAKAKGDVIAAKENEAAESKSWLSRVNPFSKKKEW